MAWDLKKENIPLEPALAAEEEDVKTTSHHFLVR